MAAPDGAPPTASGSPEVRVRATSRPVADDLLLRLLRARNAVERDPFEEIAGLYARLHRECQRLRASIADRERRSTTDRRPEDGVEVAKLQRQLIELQGELASLFRQKMTEANERADILAKRDQLRDEVTSLREELERERRAHETARTRDREVQESSRKALAESELLVGEVTRLRDLLSVRDREVEDLQARIIAEKEKAAKTINDLTALLDTTRAQLRELAAAGPVPEGGGGSGGGGGGGGGGAAARGGAADDEEREFIMIAAPRTATLELAAHEDNAATALTFSDNGNVLATAGSDGKVCLWDVVTGRAVSTIRIAPPAALIGLDYSNDLIVTGGASQQAYVIDVKTGRVLRTLAEHKGKVHASYLFRDARYVVTGSTDRTIKCWEASSGRCLKTFSSMSIVNDCRASSDGNFILSAHQDGSVKLWDVRRGDVIVETREIHTSTVTSVSFSRGDASGRVLSSGRDNACALLDGKTLEPIVHKGAPVRCQHSRFVLPGSQSRAALSPSSRVIGGGFVAAGGADGSVFLWRADTGALETILESHRAPVNAVAWSKDGRRLASCDERGNAVVWQ